MNLTLRAKAFMRATGPVVAILLLTPAARAFPPPNLSGTLDVTGVSSKADSTKQQTLKQDYSVSWRKYVTPYVTLRASMRYYKFDLGQKQSASVWQEEYQPAGELTYRHPGFSLSAGVRRRSAKGNSGVGSLTSDNLALALKTRMGRYPGLTLRYDWDHIYSSAEQNDRDTRDRRFQAGLDYSVGTHSFAYSFTRSIDRNVVSALETSQNQHLFRWSQMTSLLKNNRLRLGSSYTFNYRSQTDKSTGTGKALQIVPIATALYAQDPSPDFGTLDSMRSLADGNTQNPAQPQIDIGGSSVSQNLGVDLGIERSISTLFVYTDRPSDNALGWRVYSSNDNISWQLVTAAPNVAFNTGFNRYEVGFEAVSARYVKVVNVGFNDIPVVLVTELQALRELGRSEETNRAFSAHLADVTSSYLFSDKLKSSLDFSYQREPSGELSITRDNFYYSFTTGYRQSQLINHSVKWQQGFQSSKGPSLDFSNRTASYTALVSPLQTLQFSFSLYSRIEYIDGMKNQENNSVLWQSRGTPLTAVSFSTEVSFSRNNQYDQKIAYDTWNYRLSSDAAITRSLSTTLQYFHQSTRAGRTDSLHLRNQYGIGFNYRVTRTIFVRGTVDIVDDVYRFTSQEYALSWNASPKLTLGSQVYVTDDGRGVSTTRYNAYMNYQISSPSSLYFSYTGNDFGETGGSRTTSIQAGFRTGF